ncbi:ribosome bioproteinsis protein ytm1 [Umbelopsis nana]
MSVVTDLEQVQVQVRFTTQQQKYAITESAIFVPANFKRYGLSGIVNHLLGNEKPVPFDFLIHGELLRTSVAQYLAANNVSTENVINIEYVESMLPPTPVSAFQHDDWISSVKGQHTSQLFLTGSYDSMVRLWNMSGECVATLEGHADAVKSVAFGATSENEVVVFSSSLDQTVMAWEYSLVDSSCRVLYQCKGHKGSVEAVAVDKTKTQFATASADSTIKVWATRDPSQEESMEYLDSKNKKRRKTSGSEAHKVKSYAQTLNGHVGPVTSVTFDLSDSNTVYTGGWDHSIRIWDVEQQVNVTTKNCEKVVLDIAQSHQSKMVATGHGDKVIRIWDPRADDSVAVSLTLAGHSNWVSSVSWSPNSEYTLCSGSYDSTVRVWDIRSKGSLFTIQEEDKKDKVYSVHWDGDKILSGGEDKKLNIHQAKI